MMLTKRPNLFGLLLLLMLLSLGFGNLSPIASYAQAQLQATATPLPKGGQPTATPLVPTSTPVPTLVPTQTPAPAIVPTILPSGNNIPFSSLIQRDILLYGPFDAQNFSFDVPSEWELQQGARLQLNLSVFIPGSEAAVLSQSYAGSLLVYFNDQLLGQVALTRPGDLVATLDMPVEALKSVQRDGRHQIALEFDSGLSCITNLQMNVLVRASSLVILPHAIRILPTDLGLLPRPIIQRSFIPDGVLVVVPDQPSAAELQGAMAVSAGLGRMSNGRALVSLLSLGQLTDDLRKSNHIVMLAKPEVIPTIGASISIPDISSVAGTPAANADDGIVHMLVSPWNSARAVLLISGTSDAGIIKAAQAVSAGQVRATQRPDLAIVSEVRPDLQPTVASINRTLGEFGYPQRVLRESGNGTATFEFFIPGDKSINGEAYFDLWFAHSGQLDFGRSNASVLLNDQPVGGLTFTEATTRLTKARFGLPRSAMHTGMNELKVEASLLRTSGCYINDDTGLWMSIMPESLLYVPLGEGNGVTQRLYDLSIYPSMFLVEPNMSKLGFVVAKQDISGWQTAAQLAFSLGTRSNSSFSDLALAYADAIPDELRNSRDLIMIGRPSTLPVVTEINDRLPAPFGQGSDLALERNTRVQYRIDPGASIGYLQLLQSPWNATRGVLAVLGSDNAGVSAAANALITPEQRSRLDGTLAIIDRQQIIPSSSIAPLQLTSAAPDAPAVNVPGTSSTFERPAWLMPTIVGLGLALIGLIIGVIVYSLRRRQVGIR